MKKISSTFSLLFIFMFSFCICSVLSAAAEDQEFYISGDGQDQPDCSFGTKERPWRSLATQYQNKCILPGDTVIFRPGTYDSETEVFNGRINVRGETGSPITIKAEKTSASQWPVKFLGNFIISDAQYLVIDGIDFERKQMGVDIISIGASQITIQNCKVHGSEEDYSDVSPSSGDCIKIAGGMKIVEDITLVNNEIFFCSQDAIDITGRKQILVKDNHIHDAWIFQIKGGSEDITVDNNTIEYMHYGISSNGMDCSAQNIYCGSPSLPGLAVEDRYEANNVTITNNTISNISGGRAIDFSGWKNAIIRSNHILDGAANSGYVISSRNNVGTVFYDDLARQYCPQNQDKCTEYDTESTLPYYKIQLAAENIRFENNRIESQTPFMIKIESNTIENPDSLRINNNNFVVENQQPIFMYNDRRYNDIQDIPLF